MKRKKVLIGAGIFGLVALIIKNQIAKSNPPKIFYRKKLTGNYNARTIPPFGIYILESEKDNELLIKHELVHWEQYQKLGLFRYYIEYVNQLTQFGYDEMPMQLEARYLEDEAVRTNYTEAVRNGDAVTIYDPDFRRNNTTKAGRFVNSIVKIPTNRIGECKPEQCSTLDGKQGGACCKMTDCKALKEDKSCSIYNLRPRNCRVFPISKDDLELVHNCSYSFE